MCSRCRSNRSKSDENVAPGSYGCNRIAGARDDPVTGTYQSLRIIYGESRLAETPIPSNAFVRHVCAGLFARENALVCSCARQVGDRRHLHEFGGGFRRQVDCSKYLSSADSSWEHLMSNSSESANSVTRLYRVSSRALRVDLRDRGGIVHEGVTRAPRLDGADVRPYPPAMTPLDPPNTAPWSPVLAFFMEGFALYGASYCASPHAIVTWSVDSSRAEASAPQPEEISWRERRGAMAIVPSSTRSKVMELEDDADRAGPGSEAASGNASFITDRSNRGNWLTKPWTKSWHAIASRWVQRHREREIKKAIAALVESDGRASRNFGIPNRSRDEQVARYRHDS
jgi:hypothetical protein